MSSSPGGVLQSPEEQAFPSFRYSLINAISNPDILACQLCAKGIITDANRINIAIQPTTEKNKKSWELLSAVGGQIKATPSIFHRFVDVLRVQDEPLLRDIGQRLKDAYEEYRDIQTSCFGHTEDDADISEESHATLPSPLSDTAGRALWSDCQSSGTTQLKPDDLKDLKVLLQDVAGYWIAIADQLGMGSQVINIQRSPHNIVPSDFLRDLLNRWVNQEHPRPTLEALCRALCDDAEIIGGAGVARRLKEMFQRRRGPMQTAPQPPSKRMRLDDDHIDTQGATYQSYCSNIHDVYRGASFEERNCWPPMGRVKYINLAILKSERLTAGDDYTLMTIQRSADDIVSKKKRIGYVELFDGLESGSKILVEGRPGCGKTTLLNRISLDWATKKILKGNELLLLVPLRRFHGKPEVELGDMLRLYDTGCLCESVATQISLSGGKGVCIVLDGLDEYPPCSEPGNFVLELLEGRKLPNSVVIASSRPAAAQDIRQHATKRVEILGFLRPEVQQYIQEHYKHDNDKLKSLSTYLEHHPNIRHMCYLPLHLAMVVYLNDFLESGSLPRTETGVYEKFMLYTLLRDMRRDSQSNAKKLSDVKQLRPEKLEVFRNICSLAYSATVQSEQIFSRSDVQEVFSSNEFSLASLGLLTEDRLFCDHGLEETYSFAHLTFQEFLAAYHLTELRPAEQIEAAEQHAGEKHMGVIWKFYCGLTKLSGEVAMDVFRVLMRQDDFNPLLLLLSIHESQNPNPCSELLSSKNGVLCLSDEVLTPADMLALAYCMRNASISLTELSFQSCYLGNEELQVLTSECSYPLMNVKRLSLKKTLIRKKVVSSFLTFLGRVPDLECLEFPRFSRPPSAEDLAVAFSSLKALKSLITSLVVVTSCGGILHLLKTIPTLETIRCCGSSLDLEVHKSKEFAQETTVRIFNVKRKREYEVLSVKTSTNAIDLFKLPAIHDVDAHVIAELFKLCPKAQEIALYHSSFGDSGLVALSECLRSISNLQELTLYRNHIGDEGCATLSQALKECRQLQHLNLSWNEVGDEGCAALSRGLQECRELQMLDLSANKIGDEGCAALSRGLQECRELQTLNLSNNKIGDEGCAALSRGLQECRELQTLNLSRNEIGDEGCAALSRGLQECRELQSLDLGHNSLTDASVKSISEILSTVKSLKTLHLSANEIGDEGCAALSRGLQECRELQTLILSHNKIGDEGCAALSRGLQECRELQILDLRSNSLTDASVKSISEIITTVKSLKALFLDYNKFTGGGKAQLRQAAEKRKSYPDFVQLGLSLR